MVILIPLISIGENTRSFRSFLIRSLVLFSSSFPVPPPYNSNLLALLFFLSIFLGVCRKEKEGEEKKKGHRKKKKRARAFEPSHPNGEQCPQHWAHTQREKSNFEQPSRERERGTFKEGLTIGTLRETSQLYSALPFLFTFPLKLGVRILQKRNKKEKNVRWCLQ